jgi:ribosome-associated heat shock protein Hsp15
MTHKGPIRIDKFLWSVRIYKTRSIASDACNKGKIIVNNIPAKPSRIIAKDDIIHVKKPPIVFTFRVIEPIDKRTSAKLLEQYVEDMTTDEEKAKLDLKQTAGIVYREKGSGRPTKKERRVMDRMQGDLNNH